MNVLEDVRLTTCITKVRSGFADPTGKISLFIASLGERYPVELFFAAPSCSRIRLRERIECMRSPTSFDVAGMLESAWGANRHPTLLPKMVNSGTAGAVACEVPVWYDKSSGGKAKIDVLATDPEGKPAIWGPDRFVGHVDILSIDGDGLVHIWDYKPGAASERWAASQLTFYAIALADCADVHFDEITCHYFDGDDTFSFKPSDLTSVTADFVENAPVFVDSGEVISKSSRAKCVICRKFITDPTRREISVKYRGTPYRLCYHLGCAALSELAGRVSGPSAVKPPGKRGKKKVSRTDRGVVPSPSSQKRCDICGLRIMEPVRREVVFRDHGVATEVVESYHVACAEKSLAGRLKRKLEALKSTYGEVEEEWKTVEKT